MKENDDPPASLDVLTLRPTGMPALLQALDYVPLDSTDHGADLDAARRMTACLGHWIASRGLVATDAPEHRAVPLLRLASFGTEFEHCISLLGDKLLPADSEAGIRHFLRKYAEPREGAFIDDYFRLLVAEARLRSLRDVRLDEQNLGRITSHIDSRLKLFQAADPRWRAAIKIRGAVRPALWRGGRQSVWLKRMAGLRDLARISPHDAEARTREFWSLVDAAPGFDNQETATALIETFEWGLDADILQSVHRALSSFSRSHVLQAVRARSLALVESAGIGEAVEALTVNLSEVELSAATLSIMDWPESSRRILVDALQRLAAEGDETASELLRRLGPD